VPKLFQSSSPFLRARLTNFDVKQGLGHFPQQIDEVARMMRGLPRRDRVQGQWRIQEENKCIASISDRLQAPEAALRQQALGLKDGVRIRRGQKLEIRAGRIVIRSP
jgi:hypothetical protein